MRTELKLGLLVYAAAFGLNCFVPLPELVLGAASALALCLDVIGILPQPLYQSLKRAKKALRRAGKKRLPQHHPAKNST